MSPRAWIAFAALSVIWGIPYFFIRLALDGLPPVCVACVRVALGAAVLLPIAWKRGALRSLGAHKRAIVLFAVLELVGPFVLIALGERWISTSLTGILIATVPLTVTVMSPAYGLKERLGPRRLVGLAIGFAGVVALLGLDSVSGPLEWAGVGCMLLATVGYASGPLIIQRHLAGVDGLGAMAASLGVATVILLPAAVLSAPATAPSPQVLGSMAVLGLVCTALGLSLFFFLVGEAGAARAAVITYINPAVAALLGVLLLGERFGAGSVVGLGLILFGSWLATSKQK